MYVNDFNQDGKEELAVILYVGSGTGVSIDELHIISLSEEEYIFTESENETIIPNPMYFKDIVYESDRYHSQLLKEIQLKSYYNSDELWVDVHIGDKKRSVKIGPFEEKLTVKDDTPVLGNIVSFDVEEGRLKAKFALGLLFESWASPYYIGDIYADVNYQMGEFSLENLYFSELEHE
jgi:hypothetical protein